MPRAAQGLRRHQRNDQHIGGHGQAQRGGQAALPEHGIHARAQGQRGGQRGPVRKPGCVLAQQHDIGQVGEQEAGQARDEQIGQHQEHVARHRGRQRRGQPAGAARGFRQRRERRAAAPHLHDSDQRKDHGQRLEQPVPVQHVQHAGGGGQRAGLDGQGHPQADAPLHGRAQCPLAGQQHAKPQRIARRRGLVGMPQEQRHPGDQRHELQARKPAQAALHVRCVEHAVRVQVEGRPGKALRHVGRAPPGRLEPDAQLVAPAPRMPAVMDELPVHHGVGPQRIPALQQAARAVDTGLAVVFGLEGAEQAVPDDEDAAVVPVQVAVIDGVVHAVVAGRAEPAVEPAQAPHLLGMDPELVEQIDQAHDGKHQRRHAGQRHGKVEQPAQQRARAGLAQRRRQVVVLALVVHGMRGPEHGHFVAHAVKPVVAEVVEQQGQQPAGNAGPEGIVAPQRQVLEGQRVQTYAQQLGEDGAGLAEHAQADGADGVGQPVGIAPAPQAHAPFQRDQQQKGRSGEDNDLAG